MTELLLTVGFLIWEISCHWKALFLILKAIVYFYFHVILKEQGGKATSELIGTCMFCWLILITKVMSPTNCTRRTCKFSKLNTEIRFAECTKIYHLCQLSY